MARESSSEGYGGDRAQGVPASEACGALPCGRSSKGKKKLANHVDSSTRSPRGGVCQEKKERSKTVMANDHLPGRNLYRESQTGR